MTLGRWTDRSRVCSKEIMDNNDDHQDDLIVVQESTLIQELLLLYLIASTDIYYLSDPIVGLPSCHLATSGLFVTRTLDLER